MKNIRGAVHALQEIVTSVGVVKWIDIVRLQKIQKTEGLRAANKLSTRHVNFKKEKMNVSLAAQTFSSSVANAFRYAAIVGYDGLADCEGTANFVSVIEHLFDISNSRSPVARGFKGPLRPENLDHTEKFLMKAKSVLLSITDMTGTKVCYGKRKIGVIGFFLNIESVLGLAKELLLGHTPIHKVFIDIQIITRPP